jgi:hypothetical protein
VPWCTSEVRRLGRDRCRNPIAHYPGSEEVVETEPGGVAVVLGPVKEAAAVRDTNKRIVQRDGQDERNGPIVHPSNLPFAEDVPRLPQRTSRALPALLADGPGSWTFRLNSIATISLIHHD